MTDEYINEQNEIEENDGDANWDIENPYMNEFDDDSDIIPVLYMRAV